MYPEKNYNLKILLCSLDTCRYSGNKCYFSFLKSSHYNFITTILRLKTSSKLIFRIVCFSFRRLLTLLSPFLMITGLHSHVSCTDCARVLGHNRTSILLTILLNRSFDFVTFPYLLWKIIIRFRNNRASEKKSYLCERALFLWSRNNLYSKLARLKLNIF